MAVDDLTKVFATLFTAPVDATVDAAAKQREIWVRWLQDMNKAAKNAATDDAKKAIIEKHMDIAPVWKLSAQVSAAVTMRVASIKRMEGSATLGLGIGLLQAAGSFGFMSETSSESVLQASANYALSNETEVKLGEYLEALGTSVVEPTDVNNAIKLLGASDDQQSGDVDRQ